MAACWCFFEVMLGVQLPSGPGEMTGFDQLVGGFAVALSWKGLLYCFIGCLWGTVVGVLPGLGPLAGMTLLLPLTFGLDPTIGIIMLTGIFYGAMYGGSTTSILVRIPGRGRLGGDLHRRLRNGAPRTRRPGVDDRRTRQLHRRHRLDPWPDAHRSAAGEGHDRDRPVGAGRADAACARASSPRFAPARASRPRS